MIEKDSEVISRLIFLAFIANPEPVPEEPDGTVMLSWTEAMQCYANAVIREHKARPYVTLERFDPESEAAAQAAPAPEPEPPPKPKPQRQKKQAAAPPVSRENAAAEKKRILAELEAFRAKYGPGCLSTIERASGGAVTEWDLRDMLDAKKVGAGKWTACGEALERLKKDEASHG